MRRVFHDEEDQKLANRWLLINATAYSAGALMIVSDIGAFAVSHDAELEGLRGPAPGLNKRWSA